MDIEIDGSKINEITATLHYLEPSPKWSTEKPFTLFVNVKHLEGAENTNITKQAIPGVAIQNIRHETTQLSLDGNGFEVVTLNDSSQAESFEDPSWVEQHYYPFVSNLVAKRLGAREVRIYQHKVCSI